MNNSQNNYILQNVGISTISGDYFKRTWYIKNADNSPYDWSLKNIVSAKATLRDHIFRTVFMEFSTSDNSLQLSTGQLLWEKSSTLMNVSADTYDYDLQFTDVAGNKYTRIGGQFIIYEDVTSSQTYSYATNFNTSNSTAVVIKMQDFGIDPDNINLFIDPTFAASNIGSEGVSIIDSTSSYEVNLKSISSSTNIQITDFSATKSIKISTDAVSVAKNYTDNQILI